MQPRIEILFDYASSFMVRCERFHLSMRKMPHTEVSRSLFQSSMKGAALEALGGNAMEFPDIDWISNSL
jgi:hypothetical protein